jgi:hypothetical protein
MPTYTKNLTDPMTMRNDPRSKAPAAVVDLSNVCCSELLGGSGGAPQWSCFAGIRRAWVAFAGDGPLLLAVADANLRYRLSERDRTLLVKAGRAGVLREVPSPADDVILDLAERSGALVVSADNFVDYRHSHPWIQGNQEGFLGWAVDSDGVVSLVRRDMGVRSSFSISRAEERGEMKARHIATPDAAYFLEREYRCSSDRMCVQRALSPDHLLVLPVIDDDGAVTCPGCGGLLEVIGPRRPAVELKVRIGSQTVARIRLAQGDSVTLGRESASVVDLSRSLDGDDLLKVSRQHVGISMEKGMVWVQDLGSANGTSILPLDDASPPAGDAFRRLPPGERVRFGSRDRVVLAGVVDIERSGQRFPTAAPPARGQLEAPAPGEPPSLIVPQHDDT